MVGPGSRPGPGSRSGPAGAGGPAGTGEPAGAGGPAGAGEPAGAGGAAGDAERGTLAPLAARLRALVLNKSQCLFRPAPAPPIADLTYPYFTLPYFALL